MFFILYVRRKFTILTLLPFILSARTDGMMQKHLSVIGVLQEDLSPGGAVCQNLRKGIVNWKGRFDTHEVLKNCLSSHDFRKNGTKCIEKKNYQIMVT